MLMRFGEGICFSAVATEQHPFKHSVAEELHIDKTAGILQTLLRNWTRLRQHMRPHILYIHIHYTQEEITCGSLQL